MKNGSRQGWLSGQEALHFIKKEKDKKINEGKMNKSREDESTNEKQNSGEKKEVNPFNKRFKDWTK